VVIGGRDKAMHTSWTLANHRVRLKVFEIGGFIGDMQLDGWPVPLHRAPWLGESLDPSIPPVLQHLQGDFFCAPFGDADVDPSEHRPHGKTANGSWIPLACGPLAGHWKLDGSVCGAEVHKFVWLDDNSPLVHQRHRFIGGSGCVPMGHHLMLHTKAPIHLFFSPYDWIATPPHPVETPESGGRSLLAYNRRFDRLEATPLASGEHVDASIYPRLDRHEDILMLRTRGGLPYAWSAALCAKEDWAWFALKNPAQLPGTVLWMSNGGRDYAPWLGRHQGVIGIEETCSYFHLGHRASQAPNPLSEQGRATCLTLEPGITVDIEYTFGFQRGVSGASRIDHVSEKGELHVS